MRLKWVIFFMSLVVLLWCGSLLALRYNRIVKPVKSSGDVVLTTTLYGIGSSDKITQRLIYVCYVAGFLDAIQMQEVDPKTCSKFLKYYNGKTMGQIVKAIDEFYKENPEYRKEKPAEILLNRRIFADQR